MDRLFIDGKEVEFGGEVGIFLTYRSNIMSPDIGKLLGTSSNTIVIPRTLHNSKIFEQAQIVANSTSFPHIRHSAEVLRDGIPLVTNATLILLKSTPEEYEVALTYGVSENLRTIAEAQETLPVLHKVLDESYIWERDARGSHGFPDAHYGLLAFWTDSVYGIPPVVYLDNVIRSIEELYDIRFSFPESFTAKMPELCIPIMRSEFPPEDTQWSSAWAYMGGTVVFTWAAMTDCQWTQKTEEYDGRGTTCKILSNDVHLIASEFTATIRIKLRSTNETILPSYKVDGRYVQDVLYFTATRVYYTKEDNGASTRNVEEVQRIYASEVVEEEQEGNLKVFRAKFHWKGSADSLAAFDTGDEFGYFLQVWDYEYDHVGSVTVVESEPSYAKMTWQRKSSSIGDRYYTYRNLPEIDILDFMKALMQMFGMFPYKAVGNTVYIQDYPTFFSRREQAQDWSRFLCLPDTSASKEMTYTPDGFAEMNRVEYKDDTPLKGMNGTFNIPIAGLENERTYISLPFSSVEAMESENRTMVYIPLYNSKRTEVNNNAKVTVERDAGLEEKAYLLRVVEEERPNDMRGSYFYITRQGLTWKELLKAYYKDIIDSVSKARYITATFHFDALTLQGIDLGTPVYLSQYASYFAIIEIKAKANNLAEVKLLKLV